MDVFSLACLICFTCSYNLFPHFDHLGDRLAIVIIILLLLLVFMIILLFVLLIILLKIDVRLGQRLVVRLVDRDHCVHRLALDGRLHFVVVLAPCLGDLLHVPICLVVRLGHHVDGRLVVRFRGCYGGLIWYCGCQLYETWQTRYPWSEQGLEGDGFYEKVRCVICLNFNGRDKILDAKDENLG